MHAPSCAGRRAAAFLSGVLLLLAAPLVPALAAGGGAVYVVQLKAKPLASYTGGLPGMPATSPKATGQRLLATSAAAVQYRAHLGAVQDNVLARLAGAPLRVTYAYRTALAGFAAPMTPAQAAQLRRDPAVLRVWKSVVRKPTAAPLEDPVAALAPESPVFLGLPAGLWARLGGPDHAGEGVIVGVLDTGIYPDHPSFADTPVVDGKQVYQGSPYAPPKLWFGACEAGERFPASACNSKLIGARFFVGGYGPDNIAPDEALSPLDTSGHGSHTAGTAAGNFGVDPSIFGNDLGVDLISGIAPRAYVAAYKVCWNGRQDPGHAVANGCNSADTTAAIDRAVFDGVDVINFSVGGGSATGIGGPDGIAFFGASDAGVFVANSAGNAGPGPSTVGDPTGAPWLTSVGASQIGRTFQATATIAGAARSLTVTGASVTAPLGPTPLVDAAGAVAAGADPAKAELCMPGTLSQAAVAGRVVLCKRGVNARIEKGKVVRDAGGLGMILFNQAGVNDLVTDNHWIPTVHVDTQDGLAIRTLIAEGPATASLTGGRVAAAPIADVLPSFTSRGPPLDVPQIAKPDLVAPGVNILAANTPTPGDPEAPQPPGALFQAISGTSMAAPHVAGAGALLTQLHPGWSPAAIKSALMTTANPKVLVEDGTTPATPFDAGSGRIDPNRAAEPGLVVEALSPDYLRYVEGLGVDTGSGLEPIRPQDLNLPSIALPALSGADTITRVFTSVDPTLQTWQVGVEGLEGIRVDASPTVLAVAPGGAQPVQLTISQSAAPFDRWSFGAIVLTNRQDGRTVRLPVSVRPVRLVPQPLLEVQAAGAAGSAPLEVTTGFGGDLVGLGWGLAAPRTVAGEKVADSPLGGPEPEAGPGVNVYDVTVHAGAQALVAATSNVDGGGEGSDIDLYTYRDADGDGRFSEGELLIEYASAGFTGDESVRIPLPEAGRWRFVVVGFLTHAPSTYDFSTWLVADGKPDDAADPPAITVTGDPAAATIGGTIELAVNWSGVQANGTYYGLVTYHDASPGAPPPADPAGGLGLTLVKLTRGTGPQAGATALAPGAVRPAAGVRIGPEGPAAVAAPSLGPAGRAAPAAPAGVVGAPARAGRLALVARSAAVRGRTLVLKLGAARGGVVRAAVLRGGVVVARAAATRLRPGATRLALPLDRRLPAGRYTVRLTVRTGGGELTRLVRTGAGGGPSV